MALRFQITPLLFAVAFLGWAIGAVGLALLMTFHDWQSSSSAVPLFVLVPLVIGVTMTGFAGLGLVLKLAWHCLMVACGK